MRIRAVFATLTITSMVLFPVCSGDSTTDPIIEKETPIDGVDIAYETDAAAAVTADITSAGGKITATASDGIVYALDVAPGAVTSTVSVTMTPLKSFTVTDVDISTTSAAGAPRASTGCYKGVVFEPAGTEFDTLAVLTMTYPPGTAVCDLDANFRVVYFEPAWNAYEIMPTTFDDGANTLTCPITHFSIFGTDDPSRERLEALISVAAAEGLTNPGEDVLYLLESYVNEAEDRQWDDLAAAARAGVEATVRSLGAKGNQECNAGRREEGKILMKQAFDWADEGWVDDPAFLDDVDGWLALCGEVSVELTADKDLVTDIALSEDSRVTFVDFTGTVHSYSGKLLEGHYLGLERIRDSDGQTRYMGSETSDASGKVRFRYECEPAPHNSDPDGMYTYILSTVGAGTDAPADQVKVRLKRREFRLSFSYSYHYFDVAPNIYDHRVDAVFEIGGTRTSRENKDCYWNRSYSLYWHNQFATQEAHLMTPDFTVCIHTIRAYWVNSADEYQSQVWLPRIVEVSTRSAGLAMVRTEIDDQYGPRVIEEETDLRIRFGEAYPPYPEVNTVELEYHSNGDIDEYFFEGDTPDGYGHGVCTIGVQILPLISPPPLLIDNKD
jgi:hypothetical protein